MGNQQLIEKLSKMREFAEQAADTLGSGDNEIWELLSRACELLDERVSRLDGSHVESEMEKRYTNKSYKQFVRDMERADLEVKHYRGRFFYEGPSVIVEDLTEVTKNTSVKVQSDSMGLSDIVVYPR